MVDHHHLAMLDVADKARADHVEGAGLRSEDRMAIQIAEDEGADAQGIADADQLLVGDGHKGVATLDLPQGVDETVHEARPAGPGDQVQDHF